MKRVTLLLAAVLSLGVSCFAQNEDKFKTLKEDLAKSDAAIQDPKKGINPKTWMDRGKLFQDIYGVNVNFIRVGMMASEAKIFFKKNPKITSEEKDGVLKETYQYSQIKLFFEDGVLTAWDETQFIVDNPLMKAVEAYQKAASLDAKGKNTKKINDTYKIISNDLESKAFNEFHVKRYKRAHYTATNRIAVSKLLGITDTIYYYYAGFFAFAQSSEVDSSMWKQSIDHLSKAVSFGFEETGDSKGGVYKMLYHACTYSGKPDEGLKYLQTGFEKYPENVELIYELINYYLLRGESKEALEYVKQAEARGPQNSNLLFAKGKLLDELGFRDEAFEAYDAAIAIDPNDFKPYFNKAVVYYNSAIKMMDDANQEKTIDGFETKRDLAEAEFKKAIDPLEKAHNVSPNDREIMETLKTLYYRLKTKHPEYESKYNDIVKRLE